MGGEAMTETSTSEVMRVRVAYERTLAQLIEKSNRSRELLSIVERLQRECNELYAQCDEYRSEIKEEGE